MDAGRQTRRTPKKPKTLPLKTRLLNWLFAYQPWRKPGSRVRRVMSRLAIYACVVMAMEAIWSHALGQANGSLLVAVLGSLLSVAFFAYTLVVVPLLTTDTFHLKTRRVLGTALISTLFMILTFAHIYRWAGLKGPDPKAALDYVYFSAVTFSTLGFGDFQPEQTVGRLMAALQALLGNLHLAIIVAAIFLRMSRRIPPQRK